MTCSQEKRGALRDFVMVSGQRCEVQKLDTTAGQRKRGAPKAEVVAPEGYEFSGGETVLEAHSAADLNQIERDESLTEIEEAP